MNVLLTGGSGFLGSALALHLLDAGHGVSLLLRPKSSLARLKGRETPCRVARCATDAEVQSFIADIRPDAVIHTACAYGRQGETALQVLDANVRFGLVVLQALTSQAGERKPALFINTGSALAPEVSPYALSKWQFAQWGRALVQQSQHLQFINVQLQHMYGPGDDASKFTTHVIEACRSNQPTLALTAGEQARDFIYIDDVARGYATLLQRAADLARFDEIEMGSGEAPTVRQFVETVHQLSGSRTELQFGAVPYRPFEAMHCQADICRMRQLGWQPQIDLPTGVRLTLESSS